MSNRVANKKQFELKDHLGNVRHRIELAEMAVISDCKNPETANIYTANKTAEIQNIYNYYSFGMPLHRRNYTSSLGSYRFGFNGKENDNEVKGEGNSLDFGGRIYDSRLGRWLSLDPLMLKFPNQSPYNFVYNDVIRKKDIDGKYGSDGHFWTVYALGLTMGLSNTDALRVAKAAEYYDNIVNGDELNKLDFVPTTVKDIFVNSYSSWDPIGKMPTWAYEGTQYLHCLTGGSQKEAERYSRLAMYRGCLRYLHTFADSKAHSMESTDNTKMFPKKYGHVPIPYLNELNPIDKDADIISKRGDRYMEMVSQIVELFSDPNFQKIHDIHPLDLNPNLYVFKEIAKAGLTESQNVKVFKAYVANLSGQYVSFEKDDAVLKSIDNLGILYTISIVNNVSLVVINSNVK